MTCEHCTPADDAVIVRVRVTTFESHSALCPSLGSTDTGQAPIGRHRGAQPQEESSHA